MRSEDSRGDASISTPGSNLGRHVFGAAALAFGLITLAWHEYNGWHLPQYIVYPAAAAEIIGGAAIQFRRTAKMGAVVLGAVYLVFALRCVPQIFATTADLQQLGQLLRTVLPGDRSRNRLCALVIVIAMVPGNAESDRPHSCRHLCRFLYSGTGFLSWPYRHFGSEVASTNSDVLGGNDDCSVRTRGGGCSYESNGTSCDSPSDHDARDLWATGVDTAACFGSPQSYELERNRRDLRDCRSSVDSRRSPRRVSAY